MRTLAASALKPGDVVRIDHADIKVTHVSNGSPVAGRVLVTTSEGRAFGLGAAAQIEIVGLS